MKMAQVFEGDTCGDLRFPDDLEKGTSVVMAKTFIYVYMLL